MKSFLKIIKQFLTITVVMPRMMQEMGGLPEFFTDYNILAVLSFPSEIIASYLVQSDLQCVLRCIQFQECTLVVIRDVGEGHLHCRLVKLEELPHIGELMGSATQSYPKDLMRLKLRGVYIPGAIEKEIILTGLECNQIDVRRSDYSRFSCKAAIDGNQNGYCAGAGNKCAHTASGREPWWQVDFGVLRTVTKVMLYNRDISEGPSFQRLNNFTIQVQSQQMPDQSSSKVCVSNVPFSQPRIRSLSCENPIRGRYLVVRKGKPNTDLILLEVRAFGY